MDQSQGVVEIKESLDHRQRPLVSRFIFRSTRWTGTVLRRVAVGALGTVVIIIGIVMIVTPGPAFLVIPAGLAILGTEFPWARRQLDRIRTQLKRPRGA